MVKIKEREKNRKRRKFSSLGYRYRINAFTLIELLFIVAIIGILLAMLLPAMKKTRDQVYKTSCINNLKQLGVGFCSYVSDYDGYYPPTYVGTYDFTTNWVNKLKPMVVPNEDSPYNRIYSKVFWCPKHLTYIENTSWAGYSWVNNLSYGYNRVGFSEGIRGVQIKRPSIVVVLTETENLSTGDIGNWQVSNVPHNVYPQHDSYANVLFADAHAASRKALELNAAQYTKLPWNYNATE